MNRKMQTTLQLCVAIAIISVATAFAQDYDIDWHSVGGGGEMWSTGGPYELSGTIGQPDAGAMAGGSYTLTGGFWAVPPCWCMADLNGDGFKDAMDIQGFISCMLSNGVHCTCADMDTDGILGMNDVAIFVTDLLAGGNCP